MQVIDHAQQPVEWRGKDRNIEHRTLVNRDMGAAQITLWEIYALTDTGAPPHVHPHEETITVLQGEIKIKVDRELVTVKAGQTIFIPTNAAHSFAVISTGRAHLLIAFPVNEPVWERIDWHIWLEQLPD